MHILNNMAIERAWKDTKTSFNWKQGVTAFFVFMIGTLIHLKWAPSASETTGEIMLWLTFSVAPVIVLAVASFFYNLFCAPYTQLINIQKPWRLIRERAQLNDVRIHDLRHTYASLAVAQNLSLPIVGKLLGHKSSKSTERYAHLYTDVRWLPPGK